MAGVMNDSFCPATDVLINQSRELYRMKNLLIFAFSLLLPFSLFSQEKKATETNVEETVMKDNSRKAFLNQTGGTTEANLVNGGAFYLSNPSPTYKIEVEKAYHKPEWQKSTVRMVNGNSYGIQGRYRVIDQAFEVLHQGEAYELKKEQLQSVTIGEDRFLMMPDPMLKKRGAVIYQLHYTSGAYQLIEYHGAQWQEPKEQNMFDTSEQHRTIKPMKELILRTKGEFVKIKNHGEALRSLGVDKKSVQAKYAKKNKLKLNRSADLIQFLEYLDAR
ncbi:hypothetical protein CEQ90_06170 [Lewinellaceae bacterium SD302]|nr:hypothetical protein CEQ90_06170 [Lewinellaceae bacterium SD302]